MADKPPICTYDEVLEILSAKARSGVTQAARALRAYEKQERDVDDELERLLRSE